MRLLILEDEPLAVQSLKTIINTHFGSICHFDLAQSLLEARPLMMHGQHDLIISDVKLSDGISLDLFTELKPETPIIFTTAYDQYAIEAFDHNGVAYVLKPIDQEKLVAAVSKVKNRQHLVMASTNGTEIMERVKTHYSDQPYKKRFLSKTGNKMVIKHVDELSLFYTEDKMVYMKEMGSSKRYMINHSMDELEKHLLDPQKFFRINRSVIVNLESLSEMKNYANGRLQLLLSSSHPLDLIVARERVGGFKQWINK